MSRGWIHREQEAPGFIRYFDKIKGKIVHHRTDGPAKIYSGGGTERWMIGGELHRLDGPALINSNGDEIWFLNGKIHREDGPAVVRADGPEYYYLFDNLYSHKDWLKALGRTP